MDDDIEGKDVYELAHDLELSTHLQCEDHIWFEDEDQVVKRCNDGEHGLAAYVYTSDISRSIRVPRALHYGMIGVNEGIISDARAPFGGVKQSGQGREGGFQSGLSEYLDEKYVCVGGVEEFQIFFHPIVSLFLELETWKHLLPNSFYHWSLL